MRCWQILPGLQKVTFSLRPHVVEREKALIPLLFALMTLIPSRDFLPHNLL
jgi:hypothetical protein